ncbi:MAG: CehA/McbA family metallohydrolase [Thermoproteota archaeon]
MNKIYGNPFESSGFWVKGNLHTHTTNSDGALSPEKVVDYYSSHGYGFLALTDHEKTTKFFSEKLIVIPGTEVAAGKGALGEVQHVVAVNVEDNEIVQKYSKDSIQTLLNYLKDEGFAIIAHPYWSKLITQDLLNLSDYCGIEIYNTGCDVEVAKGFSTTHWDDLLAQKINVYGFAVDDAHWYNDLDSLGGWIYVKVREKNLSELMKSIKEGFFYASMGPTIEAFSFSNNKLEARFSPARRVDLVSDDGAGFSISMDIYNMVRKGLNIPRMRIVKIERNGDEEEVSAEIWGKKAVFKALKRGLIHISLEGFIFKNYVRLETTDANGRKAWTNPVLL